MQYGFYFDSARCTGCKTCELACKDSKNLPKSVTYRKVIDYEGGEWVECDKGVWEQSAYAYHLSVACNHCSRPVCTEVCPTGAMHKEENGIVRVNTRICVGCGYCTLACPYQAPHISPETHTNAKCDGCFDLVEHGGQPACVAACPLRALVFDDVDALRAHYTGVSEVPPLPDPSDTVPNLLINPAPAVLRAREHPGDVANRQEL